jgi:hypothetical protein
MYKANPAYETPDDCTRLWRYMNLGEFLQVLFSKELYFCRTSEFPDEWEGTLPLSFLQLLREIGDQVNFSAVKAFLEKLVVQHAISCWHANEVESVAMWALYTDGLDGVAIQTTVGRLKRAFAECPEGINICKVSYVDHSSSETGGLNALTPVLIKRRSYEHENEVRAVISAVQDNVDLTELARRPLSGVGLFVSVDLTVLVERIVLSPKYPPWAKPAIENIVSGAGLKIRVETSDLLKSPESLENPRNIRTR